MGISDQVRSKLANILFSPASHKIGSERFLHPHLPDVFLITQQGDILHLLIYFDVEHDIKGKTCLSLIKNSLK